MTTRHANEGLVLRVEIPLPPLSLQHEQSEMIRLLRDVFQRLADELDSIHCDALKEASRPKAIQLRLPLRQPPREMMPPHKPPAR